MKTLLSVVLCGLTVAFVAAPPVASAAAQAAKPAVDTPAAAATAATAATMKPDLMNPASIDETAPSTYKVKFETSKGNFVIAVDRAWAPHGADRFYSLVKNGFYDDARFFRVVTGFMVQFGIAGNPDVSKVWRDAKIQDDPVKESNKRGFVTFATAGPNTRTTQIFINFMDKNSFLDGQGFAPFGRVVDGMDVVDKLNNEYGEGAPAGKGPNQGRLQTEGNAYLAKEYPNMDYIKKAVIIKSDKK